MHQLTPVLDPWVLQEPLQLLFLYKVQVGCVAVSPADQLLYLTEIGHNTESSVV